MTRMFRFGVAVLVAVAAVLVVSPTARADEFTFHDDGDVMRVTHDSGTQDVDILCTPAENYCVLSIVRPGISIVSATGPLGQIIPPDTFHGTRVDELPGGAQSDRLYTQAAGQQVLQFLYSDWPGMEGGSLDCFYYNNCLGSIYPELTPIVETGQRQLAATIHWSDDRVDTIYFISEVSEAPPVPEPASLILLGTGLLVGGRRWRKGQANT